MFVSEVSKRYAKALFHSIADKNQYVGILAELREIEKVLLGNKEIEQFFNSPLVNADQKAEAAQVALAKAQISDVVKNLIVVMAGRERIGEWPALVQAFQDQADEANAIVRGTVRCARELGPEQRQALESRVSQVTGKKVILEYKTDESLLGGLVAEVGSLTFDDSLDTQLRLMNEDLKRRAH